MNVHEHGELADRTPAAYAVIEAARQAHGKGMMSYLIFMAVRLMEMQRVLKETVVSQFEIVLAGFCRWVLADPGMRPFGPSIIVDDVQVSHLTALQQHDNPVSGIILLVVLSSRRKHKGW